MRCFIAIKPSVEIQKYLQSLRVPRQMKQVHEHHITLKFLGETDTTSSIKKTLEKIEFKPFTLTLTEAGVFPHDNYIRVAWIGVQQDPALLKLQTDIDNALSEYKNDKSFHPHFTLGRTKKLKDKKSFMKELHAIQVPPLQCTISEFILYKSEQGKRGPVYTELQKFGSRK